MSDSPTLFGPPVGPVSRPVAKRYAARWSADARAFADSMIDVWNQAFSDHGVRANRVRRNHFVAIQLYRWLTGPENDGQAMTAEDVRAAIGLYASDPHNLKHCNGRFQCFHDWIGGCPDNVDKQLARVGRRRGATQLTDDQVAGRQYAEQLLNAVPYEFGNLARRADQAGLLLREYARSMLADLNARPRQDPSGMSRRYFGLVLNLFDRWDSAPGTQHSALSQRAYNGFTALRGRPPTKNGEDANLWAALTLALFARQCGIGLPTGQGGPQA